jgi:enamine deaminase RidA (YjgF/YER057c/UK114 family)
MTSQKLPAAVGPYSMGKQVSLGNGKFVSFTSGMLGLSPKTNELISDSVID